MFPEFLQMTKFVHCYHNFKPGHAGLPVGSIHMKSNWANWSVCWFAVLEFMAFPIFVGCTPMIEMFFFFGTKHLKRPETMTPVAAGQSIPGALGDHPHRRAIA
jgi:hypothetical protein